ncbi:endonuclease [Pseudomonas vlassakiae]|uniref:endonuclease n=1 Tax=Pseudomonas TaxID=286 RepID=UPI000C1A1484|nr:MULTISPECIES: endonuclease [unclassified Pseudomonas]AXQ50493.1 deoxyribonuclease I [Stenotrophomonas rhizophila]MBS3183962.1 endonuclease [Pseudomonas sp. PCH44]PIK79448.1 deoxyribonuclease I [Pseudomonas sp. 382]
MKKLLCAVALAFAAIPAAFATPPATFTEAKVVAKQKIYQDQGNSAMGELYCGCKWTWVGKSGGRVDLKSCGYETRKLQTRAERTEWEHIVPAWTFGHQRQCWQNGGREQCVDSDPTFRAMEADLFNLYPSVGEVNGDRSNFNYGMVSGVAPQYGQCTTRIDFQQKTAEPRDEVKGLVARTTFYMFDRYKLSMSRQQQQVLMAWDKQHPVTAWEKQRDQRIAAIMGHNNPFVTGERKWALGYTPQGAAVVPTTAVKEAAKPTLASTAASGAVVGNRNSHVYHLASGCPGYSQVSQKNQVAFGSEAEAQAAGYRKAGNCK